MNVRPLPFCCATAIALGLLTVSHAQAQAPTDRRPSEPVILGAPAPATPAAGTLGDPASADAESSSAGEQAPAAPHVTGREAPAPGQILGAPVPQLPIRVAKLRTRVDLFIDALFAARAQQRLAGRLPRERPLLGAPVELHDDTFLSQDRPILTPGAEPAPVVLGRAAPGSAPAPAAQAPLSGSGGPVVLGAPTAAETGLVRTDATPHPAARELPVRTAAATVVAAPPAVLGTPVAAESSGLLGESVLAGASATNTASGAAGVPAPLSFRDSQLSYPRVRAARWEREPVIQKLFLDAKIPFPSASVFFRVFKRERVMELWVEHPESGKYQLLKSYPTCNSSGQLGPKRRQGDMQVPEGFYNIDYLNPQSTYHLSLHLDYPNASDRRLGSETLGGDIFIHGECVTIGCVALTNQQIREVYWLAVEARNAGQQRIPVHVFPTRLTDSGMEWLRTTFAHDPERVRFWEALKPGYDFFETQHRLPRIGVALDGHYVLER